MIDSTERMAVRIKLYQGPNSKPFLAYSKYVKTLKDNKAQIIAMGEKTLKPLPSVFSRQSSICSNSTMSVAPVRLEKM